MRAHLVEYGVVAPKGRAHIRGLIEALDRGDGPLPAMARQVLILLARTIEGLGAQIRKIEIELLVWYRTNQVCKEAQEWAWVAEPDLLGAGFRAYWG